MASQMCDARGKGIPDDMGEPYQAEQPHVGQADLNLALAHFDAACTKFLGKLTHPNYPAVL